jgi:mannose-6-phosphate isomerase
MSCACDDGLFRIRQDEFTSFDGMGLLYDQAFVLLALASDVAAFGARGQGPKALQLVEKLAAFAHPMGGYREAAGLATPLFANPNMHLFEAFQAWMRVADDPAWGQLADDMADFALTRLIDPANGAILERFAPGWRRPPARSERFVWPGHLYEWAFLLLDRPGMRADDRAAALQLIATAEAKGVDTDRGVAIFALDGWLEPRDRSARLWAQTERLRACARAASLTGDDSLWNAALEAVRALEAFLDVPLRGLWRDRMEPDGAFVEEPAPASSLYHIVGAIAELRRQAAAPALRRKVRS